MTTTLPQSPRDTTRPEEANNQLAAQTAATAADSGVVVAKPGELSDALLKAAVVLLAPGDHGGLVLKRSGARIVGQPGAFFSRLVTISVDATFDRCEFRQGATNAARLVDCVSATSRLQFLACVFSKVGSALGDFVGIAAGTTALFNGCVFAPTMQGGNVIVNLGAAGNVHSSGANLTGRAHVNVTAGLTVEI